MLFQDRSYYLIAYGSLGCMWKKGFLLTVLFQGPGIGSLRWKIISEGIGRSDVLIGSVF